jgi:hypothetical protein
MTMKLLYNTETQKLLPWPRIDDEPVVGLAPHLLEMNVVQDPQPAYDPATQRLEKTEVIDTDNRTVTRGWSVVEVPAPTQTAEEWIDSQGYTAIRLISLLDAEAKLKAVNKESSKLNAVRQWLDSILGSYAIDPTPKNNWPTSPYSYEETIQDAILTANPET